MIGTILQNRYQIVEQLGRGGMATVFKAYQESLDRFVAIKIIHPHLAQKPDFQERFRQEARHVAALRHPNIVQVHDFDQVDDIAYMVMEYIAGPTLKAYLQEVTQTGRTLSPTEILALMLPLGRALSYAHSKGVIHRDIKSANVMLDDDGRIFLADFGLAQIITAGQAGSPEFMTGTPDYMAPEQIRGQPVDERADIYSFGVLLYEVAAGRLPFTADSMSGLLAKHLQEMPKAPSEQKKGLPNWLDQIVLKALAKKPDARYQSTEELLEALEEKKSASPILPIQPKHNLPAQTTSFIGRQEELNTLSQILQRPEVRLLTLAGPGGTGKTRLSLQVAGRLLSRFADGVFFVSLDTVRSADLVVSTIAQVLGIQETAGQSINALLQKHLQPRSILLVLDNFEHVLEASAAVAELLTAAPDLKLLVTTREILGVYGEHEYPVPPLPLPDLASLPPWEQLARNPAVALFTARAQAANFNFSLTEEAAPVIAEICSRLDGLPLAIELAAARSRLLSPAAILARLDNRLKLLTGGGRNLPARQQTLRGAIDWSYALLSEPEQELFRKMAVFVGGATLTAVEAVAGDDGDLFDRLASLVDKSLLRQSSSTAAEPRFAMLETIREYAQDRLVQSGQAHHIHRQHAAFYLALAEEAEPHLRAAGQSEWLLRLAADYTNMRVALDWCQADGADPESALLLAGALWRFWELRGNLSEGRLYLSQLLEMAQAIVPLPVRTKALNAAGYLAYFQGDFGPARRYLEQCLALARPNEEKEAVAYALLALGAVILSQAGDLDQVAAMYAESLDLFTELGNRWGIAGVYLNMGALALSQEKLDTARSLLEKSLTAARAVGDKWMQAFPTINLGELARLQNQAELAIDYYQESLALYQAVHNSWGMAYAYGRLGYMAGRLGDAQEMQRYFQRALLLFQQQDNLDGIAGCLLGLAGADALAGRPRRAARLLGATEALRERIDVPISPEEKMEQEKYLSLIHGQLNETAFAAAWQEGQKLPWQEAVAYLSAP